MIEEIVMPDPTWRALSLLIPLLVGLVGGLFIAVNYKFFLGLTVCIIGISICILIATSTVSPITQWNESVLDQVNSLPCEDLQEAYEIYKLEYIREKYAKECTDEWEWWK